MSAKPVSDPSVLDTRTRDQLRRQLVESRVQVSQVRIIRDSLRDHARNAQRRSENTRNADASHYFGCQAALWRGVVAQLSEVLGDKAVRS